SGLTMSHPARASRPPRPPRTPSTAHGTALAAGGLVLAAGAWGAFGWPHTPAPMPTRPALWLAPMIGLMEPCILRPPAPEGRSPDALDTACTGPEGSAAALVESTLSSLESAAPRPHPRLARVRYPLGYTLPVPLLQLFQRSDSGLRIDPERVGRLVRTVRDTDRPVVLYLFSTHFATGAPLETELAQDPANLAATRDGTLPSGRYYGSAIHHWSLAQTQNPLTARRAEAMQAVLDALCALEAPARARVKAVTLLGELHHFFPDFEAGMGFQMPYRVTDYSPASVAGFQRFLQAQFKDIAALNQALSSDFRAFSEITPPAQDFRTEPLERPTDAIDPFAHDSLPITGWAYAPSRPGEAPATIQIYRNGTWLAETPIALGRQDVRQALPEIGDADTGWRYDLDFRALPPGPHTLDIYLARPGQDLVHLGTRRITLGATGATATDSTSTGAAPAHALPRSQPAEARLRAHIDGPEDRSRYVYNPLVPLWHAFRGQQVVDYQDHFARIAAASCLRQAPLYTHQIVPFTNPGWDTQKFAIDRSLAPRPGIELGVSLYGEPTYGPSFARWLARSGPRPYGVTEFHPLKPLDAQALRSLLDRHAGQGAQFVSFFLEPRWQGERLPRGHNIFSFDPQNPAFGSDRLYQAVQDVLAR
ncbi:MAG: hypothetical protein PHI55_15485, partial [Burkholderiaceae bacterium]|nr:hypothetical protein [Burkholderiaceae bacterium]